MKSANPPRRRARKAHRITSVAHVTLLASAGRQEVVDGLHAIGPASIAELGGALGRAPDSLYYHMKKLLKAGLVVEAGTRGEGVHEEALYDTPGELLIDFEPSSDSERGALMRAIGSLLRAAERDLRAALEGGLAIYRRARNRNAWGSRVKGWLTSSELAEVRAHLDAAALIVLRSERTRKSSLHSLTFVLTPVQSMPREGSQAQGKSS